MTGFQKSYKLRFATTFWLTQFSLLDPATSKVTTIWRSADIVKTACEQQKEFNSTGKIPEPVKDNPQNANCGWFKKGDICTSACCDIMFFHTCKNKPSYARVGQGRILNGHPARQYKFPSAIHMQRNRNRYEHCGGSIYNEVWIITATYCVSKRDADQGYLITAAEYIYDSDDGYEQRINSTKIIPHPNYTLTSRTASVYDIALIKLDSPLKFNDKVQPAKLPAPDFFELGYAIVLGWGLGDDNNPKVLQETLQPLITTKECKKAYEGTEEVLETHLCKWYKEGLTTFCAGDSGSPTYQCLDNELVQIGINTWAVNDGFCEERTKPDVEKCL